MPQGKGDLFGIPKTLGMEKCRGCPKVGDGLTCTLVYNFL